MYQYSLSWYISLFNRSIESSQKSNDVPTRLSILRKYFTESLYSNVGRSLFEKDKLLFSFLLCIAILRGQNKIDPEEWRFLVTGGVGVTKSKLENPDKFWITDKMWSDIEKLSDLAAFTELSTAVFNSPDDWKQIFESSEPQSKQIPGMIFFECE
jgi:dynein heavy chain